MYKIVNYFMIEDYNSPRKVQKLSFFSNSPYYLARTPCKGYISIKSINFFMKITVVNSFKSLCDN